MIWIHESLAASDRGKKLQIVAKTFGEKMLLRRATSIAYTAAQQYSKTKVLIKLLLAKENT